MSLRWTRVPVLVAGAGKEGSSWAELSELDGTARRTGSAITVSLTVLLALSSLFVPPLLLLNLPILVTYSAIVMWRATRHERVRVGELSCPACGATSAIDRVGALPLLHRCARCATPIEIRAAPRGAQLLEEAGAAVR